MTDLTTPAVVRTNTTGQEISSTPRAASTPPVVVPVKKNLVVRAIDGGFGNFKFTTKSSAEGLTCDLFRSIYPRKVHSWHDSEGVIGTANRMVITVGETEYVIGKDADTAQPANAVQTLDASYPLSDGYLALVRGALAQMRVSVIGVLVVALSMNMWRENKDALRARLVGKHKVPNLDWPSGDATREVVIEEVRVMPQPSGGFLNYCARNPAAHTLATGNTLVVDAGFGTFDYILLRREIPVDTRSGGLFGSVGKIIRAVAEKHRQGLSESFGVLTRIDDSLRTGIPATIDGAPVDFKKLYAAEIKTVVDESMTALRRDVQGFTDIDHILLTGGGAHFFQQALSELAGREVLVDEDPVFSNVRGFQYAGEQYVRQRAAA